MLEKYDWGHAFTKPIFVVNDSHDDTNADKILFLGVIPLSFSLLNFLPSVNTRRIWYLWDW